jgi:FG-GAP-like repeat
MSSRGNRLLSLARRLLPVVILVLAVVATDSGIRPRYPEDDMGKDSLPGRKRAQMEAAKQFRVFYQFQFSDKLKESGITFTHHAVDDVTKTMRMGHYDHGSAVSVADVDGEGLYDIYFVNQVGGNELWKNLGGGKFKNITQDAGVALAGRVSVAAAFADIDNDGDQDLFVTTVRGGNALFENDGQGHFKDITQEAGLNLIAHSSGAFFLTMTKTAFSTFWSAMSASIPTTRRDRTASTSGYPTPLMDIFTRTVMNIPSSTRIWATTGSGT